MSISDFVVKAFAELTPDLAHLYDGVRYQSLESWERKQKAAVTGSGAAASAIPFAHLAGICADVLFLMNRMSVCSYGIGAIYAEAHDLGNFLEVEDFALVLALWSGDSELGAALTGKAAADWVAIAKTRAGLKLLAKEMAKSSGVLVGKKMGGKAAAKIGAKFGAKLGGKAAAGFIPFLGAAVGGGINLWFISGIAAAARQYYDFKSNVGRRL